MRGALGRRDDAVDIPEVFPGLIVSPKEDLAFDEAAVAIDGGDGAHVFVGERFAYDAAEVGKIVGAAAREGDGNLSALHGPLDANNGGMNADAPSDAEDDRIFGWGGVLRGTVAVRASRRAERRVADGDNSLCDQVSEELWLLEVRMEFHLVCRGQDARIVEEEIHLGHRHVGGADVADEAPVDELFKLAPGTHIALVYVGDGVGIASADVAMGRMVVGERPVDEIEVKVVELEVAQGLFAGGDDVIFVMLVVPELGGDPELFALDAGAHDLLEGFTYKVFVAVDGGAVKVAIAEGSGVEHGGGYCGMRDMIGAKCSEADGGHFCAGPELAVRNGCGVDGVCCGKYHV